MIIPLSQRSRRTPGVALAAILLMPFASGMAFATAPSVPDSLRFSVYSDTAAELFWNRSTDDGVVVAYEIRLNGTVIATKDVLSYYSDALDKGTTYEALVTAIDDVGERSAPATVTFVGGDRSTSGPGGPVGEALPRPGNLREAIYSTTAAELFWDRSTTPGLRYDVARDGATIATTDGTSHFDASLSGGRSYTYEVVAIDSQGRRSAPASVTLETPGGIPGGTPVTPPSSTTPMPPAGLVARVYSPTAAELFWTRPATFGLTYAVEREGTDLATTDGTSYFDSSLTGGRSYTYNVIAIDRQGGRSAASSVMLNTPGGGSAGPTTPGDTPADDAPSDDNTSPDAEFDLAGPASWYTANGYGTVDVVRLDVRTATTPGVCTIEDQSGCTLADVIADIDPDDDFKVDIAVHFQGADLPDDGSVSNATMRQRGGGTRLAPQKSFRVKLDSKQNLWRGERRLQMNKMPYDTSRIRNKLAFDLMVGIPHLSSLRTQFVNLWIDDGQGPEDYGLFTHAEYAGTEYLVNRGRDKDDHLYKIEEFVFALGDLDYLAVDAEGEPLDVDRFETRLGIEGGDDHRKVVEMIRAVNDNSRSFESILERYFDEENVLTWVAVNFLLHQVDAVTHNFYLYNPLGTDKFYFLPWDYDGAFYVEQEPANSFATDELFRRLYYGYSKGRASNFLNRFYRMPGIHQKVLAKAAELRNNQLMDSNINERASRYASVASPYASRLPDFEFNQSYYPGNSSQFAGYVARSHEALQNYGIPLPPKWRTPQVGTDQVSFRWEPAHDMNGNRITYDIEVSSSPAFRADDRLLLESGIAESSSGGYAIEKARIGSGTRYARLVARVTTDPARFWQIASTRPVINGEMRVGVIEFSVP